MTSTIKVDNIENQCGGAVVTKCGATTTISGSVVKADDIQAADGGNIINQCGTDITLGASGDTISLAAGASQSGFGRTGTVDWQTTKKTATFTAANGEGYFVDTSSAAITMTLPASPSAGDIVAFKDYAGTFATNNLTIGRNGSNLDGAAGDKAIVTNNTSMSLVYVDATQGWKSVEEGTGFIGETFIVATGGTETTCGNCKIHTFTGPGTFAVTQVSGTAADNVVSYMVVAGGGSGGVAEGGGGGGAGGFRELKSPITPYTASPLDGYSTPGNRITVTATSFPITVGAGGAQNAGTGPAGNPGNPSVFSTITSTGGGPGARFRTANDPEAAGGSGGGGTGRRTPGCGPNPGGNGNTPPVSPPQGNPGGAANTPSPTSSNDGGGGGGGATAAGTDSGYNTGQPGGAGATTNITASPVAYGGGGGGGSQASTGGSGGAGGGGTGFSGGSGGSTGTANTGGGGGGGGTGPTAGQAGGSGIVVIRYKFQ